MPKVVDISVQSLLRLEALKLQDRKMTDRITMQYNTIFVYYELTERSSTRET